ncbi:hypothetical protein Aab01nite_53640 [Paractinoplanes abujensis]|nr:hypothetical protein Aab01nite_53640 [Actinoplanes abujensis]
MGPGAVGTGERPRSARSARPLLRRAADGVFAVFVAVVVAAAVAVFSPAGAGAAPETTTVTGPTVADVVGEGLDVAEEALRTADMETSVDDLSSLDRQPMMDSNWAVVATTPAAGQPYDPATPVVLSVLRKTEAAWFKAHPTMPAIRAGTAADQLTETPYDETGPPGVLAGVEELVLFRYAPGYAPDWASEDSEYGVDDDEPAAERNARAGLKEARPGIDDLVRATIPRAGTKLRTGQLIVVTVRTAPGSP